ncbi:WxcM-like domain-containing protein [Candidatus Pelagibacter sp.]|nr:WxcM-like domain-containing protein [Candidatus Pelagibacter sp.]
MKSYKFKQFKKSSGTLVPFSLKKQIPFKTKRMFIIYGTKNFIRGNHAHFKCSQFLVPIYGTMTINYETKSLKKKVKINYKKKTRTIIKT